MRVAIVPVLALAVLVASCTGPKYDGSLTETSSADGKLENAYRMPFTSPGTKFAGLPPAVQNTIRAQAGAAEIHNIVKMTNETAVAYRVMFVKDLVYPPLYIAPNGSVLYPDLTVAVSAPADSSVFGAYVAGVSISDLPPAVLKTIQARAPTTEVDYIDKETRGDQVVFVVSFKDKVHNPRLWITTDGMVMKEALQ